MLFVSHISCDTLSYVILDVVVIERIVAVVKALRAEDVSSHRFGIGVRQNRAAAENYLRVRTDVSDLVFAGFFVQYERAQIFTCRRISLVQLSAG